MGTLAAKFKKMGEEKEEVVVVKVKGKKFMHYSDRLAGLIREGFDLYSYYRQVKEELGLVKKQIAEKAKLFTEDGTIRFALPDEGLECKVTFVTEFQISDVEKMRALLGERFEDLVEVKVVYKPSRKLIELASQADELGMQLRELIVMKERSPQISFSGAVGGSDDGEEE